MRSLHPPSSSSMGKALLWVGGTLAFGVVSLTAWWKLHPSSAKYKRVAFFYGKSLPILARYKWYEARTAEGGILNNLLGKIPEPEQEQHWTSLHMEGASVARDVLLELKGIYIKMGQVMGSRGDFVPKPYVEALKDFTDDIPRIEWSQLEPTVREELDLVRLSDLFKEIEQPAVSAASISQVYRCTLNDGRKAALKCQYPGLLEITKLDLLAFDLFTRLADPGRAAVQAEAAKQLLKEFEFLNEAAFQSEIGANMAEEFPDGSVVVPKPFESLLTERVLVMEWMEGEDLRHYLDGHSWGRGAVFDKLLRAYGRQIFIDGVFQGDPHFGNFKVAERGYWKKEPMLQLLDFGQAKRLPDETRRALCEVFIALSDSPVDDAKLMAALGKVKFRTKSGNLENTLLFSQLYLDTGIPSRLPVDKTMLSRFQELVVEDPISFDPDLAFVCRVAFILRGLMSNYSGCRRIKASKVWREYAERGLAIKRKDPE